MLKIGSNKAIEYPRFACEVCLRVIDKGEEAHVLWRPIRTDWQDGEYTTNTLIVHKGECHRLWEARYGRWSWESLKVILGQLAHNYGVTQE